MALRCIKQRQAPDAAMSRTAPSRIPIITSNAGGNNNQVAMTSPELMPPPAASRTMNCTLPSSSARHGVGRIPHADSFANLSIVSSLSGDDGQSVSALGLDFVDELPPMAVAGNVGSAFRHSGVDVVGPQQQAISISIAGGGGSRSRVVITRS